MKFNISKIKEWEKSFLSRYPGGFDHPDMVAIARKHKPAKMKEMAGELFAKPMFDDPGILVENMVKIISRSSMVSVFEKPKFRDYARMISHDEKTFLAKGLFEFLHGDQRSGFDMMLEILSLGKLAKWTLMTIIPVYYSPLREVYVKPTTARNVIKHFEVESLKYNARPDYDFYVSYRELIEEMKREVSQSLYPDNAAFTGFLMMYCENNSLSDR